MFIPNEAANSIQEAAKEALELLQPVIAKYDLSIADLALMLAMITGAFCAASAVGISVIDKINE